ncbi:MAG: branched-chain amino acid aminotransferase [Clostridiales bacterium]|nr:branched-chain amino acid aminotransferase [Clostridiales bacterium]
MLQISVTKTTHPGSLPPADKLGFGSVFSDHMFLMDYSDAKGWHDARIVPFGPLSLSPAANVFHYAAEVFEGLKAYRCADGSVQLFRPRENMKRLNASAQRMGLPSVPEEDALQAVMTVVDVDRNWVPAAPGTSLYVRPFLFATDPTLSLHGVHEAVFAVILSPSGSYYAHGMNPVRIMLETDDVRAVRGGTGYTKCGGNYAASNRADAHAAAKGFDQVLWLDGVERKYIEEVGAMNVMFKINGTVVTPALTGSILPGITRRSCIEMLRAWGVPVEERLLSAEELIQAARSGALEEAFGTGTAAVISPIGELSFKGQSYTVNDRAIGPTAQKLYDELTGLQWGRRPDPFGWVCKVDGN